MSFIRKRRGLLSIFASLLLAAGLREESFQYGKPRRNAIHGNCFTHQLEFIQREHHRRSQCFGHANPAVEVFRKKWQVA